MSMADTIYKMYFFLVIMILFGLSSSQTPASVSLNIVCEDKNSLCPYLQESCNETASRGNCPETCGLCREEVKNLWRHLQNMLELPYEDRTIGRGDNNYVYVLENENLTLSPDVNKVFISAIPNIKTQINPKILSEPRGHPPATFDPGVQEKITLLIDFLAGSKDGKELLKYVVNLKDHINEDIFVAALSRTLHKSKFQDLEYRSNLGLSRSDANTNVKKKIEVLLPPRHESFPTHFIKRSSFIPKFLPHGKIHGIDEDECKNESDLTDGCSCERWPGWQENKGVESKVAYWTEDRDLNNFHYRWHEYNDRMYDDVPCDDPEYRHGELFGYFHQQLLARYDMERLSNGLSRVKALNGWIHNKKFKIPEPFFGDLDNIRDRCPNETLSEYMATNVSTNRDNVVSAIRNRRLERNLKEDIPMTGIQEYSMLASILERDKNCLYEPFIKDYGALHNHGHSLISTLGCNGQDDFTKQLGPMNYLDVAVRDPVFWRWHKFLDETLQIYADNIQPYKLDELLFDEFEVTDVNVQDISGAINKLQTFRSYIETNYTFEKHVYCISQPELNHDPFDYKISIKNLAESRKVNIRIYMAPVFNEEHEEFTFEEQRNLWALMERFTFTLNNGDNVIKRGSCHSTMTTMPPLTSNDISKKIDEQFEPASKVNKLHKDVEDDYEYYDYAYNYDYQVEDDDVHGENNDEVSDCADTDPDCYTLQGSCNDIEVKKICPKTCNSCNSGTQPVVPVSRTLMCRDNNFNCVKHKSACKYESAYLMKNCQKTCGLCIAGPSLVTQSPTNACEDKIKYCEHLKDSCYKEYIIENCQKTCGRCTKAVCDGGCGQGICEENGFCRCFNGYSGPKCDKVKPMDDCEDTFHSDCAPYKDYCINNNNEHYDFMMKQCRQTCGVCSKVKPMDDCDDTFHSDCAPYKDYCINNNNEHYDFMMKQCRQTCGVCSKDVCDPECQNGNCLGHNKCECSHGWTGILCGTPICDGGCGGGTCEAPGRCRCHKGYIGTNCKQAVCGGGCGQGTCVAPGRCSCHNDYTGRNCEKNALSCTMKCGLEGRCDPLKNTCICKKGWTGVACEKPWCNGGCGEGTCVPNCAGHGKCEASGQCRCPHGYIGPNCDKEFIAVNTRKIFEVDKVCKDEKPECAHWAKTNARFCDDKDNSGYRFNADMCRKSCGFCSTACKDTLPECQKYKDKGFCERNTRVQQNCPKTCFDCKGVKGAIPCQCGLPHHLLIPKGTQEGMAFQLFVLITPYHTNDEELENDCDDTDCSVLCAINKQKCLGHKKGEALAFPFDRKLEKVGETRIKKIEDLDKILPNAKAQKIHIYHKDKVKNEQKCT